MTIKIKKSYNPHEIEELDFILSSTSTERWRTVIILCAREYIITNEKFVEQRISPLTALRKLKLPSLGTLRYSLYGPVAVSYSCFYESEGSLQVTRDWKAPKLKNMTIEGLIPFHFAKTMDSITDVTINVDVAYTEDIQFVNRTTNHFLISVPSIKSLRLIVTSPIVDKNVYDDLPVGYRKNRIDSNSRTSSTDGDDNYPTQVANESKLTHDSLYEHLTMGEDIYTSENIDNEAKRLAERNDIKLVNRLENVAMDSPYFIPARLDKLKYLEFDLDPLYDIYNLIPAYLRLSTPNVEELVFKINIPRGKRVYTLGSKTKWDGFTIEDVNLVLKYLLLNNKQHIFSGSRLPNLKYLFISVDECNDYSRGRSQMLEVPFESIPNLEHLEIKTFGLNPNFCRLVNTKLETLRLSGYPSYVVTPSLANYIKNVEAKENEWHPKQVVLNINQCTCSDTYRAVTQVLFDELKRKGTKLEWYDIPDPNIPENQSSIADCQRIGVSYLNLITFKEILI